MLLPLCSTVYAGNIYNFTASTGLMLDDNLTRAQYKRDIYDDRAFFASLSAGYVVISSDYSRAVITAAAEAWQYKNANLAHQIASLKAEYFFQPNTVFTSPWYSVSLKAGVVPYQGQYRDQSLVEFGLGMGKRLTDATNLRSGLSHTTISADSDIFSLSTIHAFANLDFKFGLNTLYTTLGYSTGDFNSTNTPPRPASLINTPWLNPNDDVAFPGLTNSWTYKLDADTWSFNLGYVLAITSNQSIDTSVLYYSAAAYAGNDYSGTIATLSYFYRF